MLNRHFVKQLYTKTFNFSQKNISKLLVHYFDQKQTKISMFQAFKIFPSYFDKDFIQQFIQSKILKQNLTIMQNHRQDLIIQERRQLFELVKLPKTVQNLLQNNQIYLCVLYYINWLKKCCPRFNIHLNNYIFVRLDLRKPHTFYNLKSIKSRTFIYHHGPTNSGKTSSALKDLKNLPSNKKGIYLAPLRLLAWEMQQKLGHCTLLTGQEKQFTTSNLTSATIEMFNFRQEFEVIVIDQIQLISDFQRGFSWTKAIHNANAKRIHLCGDQRALGLIQKLLRPGDTLLQQKYSRLSKLVFIEDPFDMESLKQGDCFVKLNIRQIKDFKKIINNKFNSLTTNKIEKNFVASVYGRLPPKCRKNQSKEFNDGRLPYLVATNAIGMGLNLNIKRIIFLSLSYRLGSQQCQMKDHQIQQIAGRAGRGQITGQVQCFRKKDVQLVKKALVDVNRDYQINLQTKTNKNIVDFKQKPQTSNISKQYSQQLKRFLSLKQCQIKQAALLVNFLYVNRVRQDIQKIVDKKITLSDGARIVYGLCELNKSLYFIQSHQDLVFLLDFLEQIGLSYSNIKNIVRINQKFDFLSLFDFLVLDLIIQLHLYSQIRINKDIIQIYNSYFSSLIFVEQIEIFQQLFNYLQCYKNITKNIEIAAVDLLLVQQMKQVCCKKIDQIIQNNLCTKKKNYPFLQALERKLNIKLSKYRRIYQKIKIQKNQKLAQL